MSKKEELSKEDLKFLKELLGQSKKEDEETPNFREFKDLKKKISENSIKDGLIQFDKKSEIISHIGSGKLESEIISHIGSGKLESEIIDLNHSHNLENNENKKRSIKKRKIKKKELFLEIAEALSLLKKNNILLNKLIQHCRSIENSFKALTQEPIKIKILK